jgi:hypothetical protein
MEHGMSAKPQIKAAVRVLEEPAEIVKVDVIRTKKYDQFDLMDENRPVVPGHVEAMKESFSKYGFLIDCPIHAIRGEDGRYKITDGQHRFLAAKALGIPFYFSLRHNPDGVDDIQIMHRYQKPWKVEDYLHHYVKRKVAPYLALQTFCKKYQLPVSNALSIMSRNSVGSLKGGGLVRNNFKSGTFTFSKDDVAFAEETMDKVNELRFLHDRFRPFSKEKAFIAALYRVVTHPHYDHAYMKEKLSLSAARLNRCGSLEDYVQILTEIYNWKRRDENRVEFKAIRKV